MCTSVTLQHGHPAAATIGEENFEKGGEGKRKGEKIKAKNTRNFDQQPRRTSWLDTRTTGPTFDHLL